MIIFLNIITIIVLAVSLSLLLNEDLYKTIPTVTISIPLIMMFIAFFTNLDIAVVTIYILMLLLFILALLKAINCKYNLKDFIVSNKFVIIVYIVLALYFLFVNYKRPTWGWDDISHWARVVKNMNFTRHLNRSTDTYLMFPHYPPNVSLFLFFFDYQKPFSEWQLFYAQSLYTVTLVLPIAFYVGRHKSNLFKTILLLFAISIPASINTVAYISLFVDNIMGILLGYAMVEYLFNDNIKYKLVNIILALMALTLTKDAGAILAIIFIIIIFTNEIYKRAYFKGSSISTIKLKQIFFILFFVVLAYCSYKFYLKCVGIGDINYVKTYGSTLSKLNPWAYTTIKNFYHKILEYDFGNVLKLSTVNIIMLFILVLILLHRFISRELFFNSKIILWCIIGFIIYLALLFYTYICSFGEYESVNLASFDRYISTYLLFLLITIISLLSISLPNVQSLLIIFISFALLFNPIEGIFQMSFGAVYTKASALKEHIYYENKVAAMKKVLQMNDTISIVSIGNWGYAAMKIAYSLGPAYRTYYIGEPSSTPDSRYSVIMTPNEYLDKLKINGVKYVYLDSINEKFINDYLVLFENVNDIKNNSMFLLNDNDKLKKIGE